MTSALEGQELAWIYSDSTIKWMIEPSGISVQRAKTGSHLAAIHAKKRYDWYKARLNWALAEWRTCISPIGLIVYVRNGL
jgi:hypothetical protein